MHRHATLQRVALFTALTITLIIAALHLQLRTYAGGLWRDEAMLVHYAHLDSVRNLTQDSFPVLMATVIYLWQKVFGGSDVSLRWLGALIGLGVIGTLWATVWNARRSPPLVGLALLGLNSIIIIYGDSVRAYGLGSLLIVLLAGVMWWFLQSPTWPRTGVLLAVAVLAVQSLFQNAVLFAAIGGGAGVVCWQRKNFTAALKILGVGIVTAASLLPYWNNFFPPSGVAAVVRSDFNAAEAVTNLATALGYPFESYFYVWLLLAVATIALGILAWRKNSADTTAQTQLPFFASMMLLLGSLGFFWFLWFSALNTQPWHFLPILALVAVCFDLGLPYENPHWRVPLFGFAVATTLVAVPFAHRDLKWRFTTIDLLAAKLNAAAAPEDFILVTPWYCSTSFERYYRTVAPWDAVPPVRNPKLGTNQAPDFFFRVTEQMTNTTALEPVFAKITKTLKSGHRVWIVGWMNAPAPGEPMPADLPPAPLKFTGWSDTPYTIRWNKQVTHFLTHHSREFGRIPVLVKGEVNYHENLDLFIASGWQTNDVTAGD